MKTQNLAPEKKTFQSYLLITKDPIKKAVENFLKSINIRVEHNSPDFSIATAQKDVLSAEEARELSKLIFQRPLQSSHKILTIPDAHKLSFIVQNSLLKILEEPPKHALIILVAQSKDNLLPTILSRVITVHSENHKKPVQDNPNNYQLESVEDLINIENPKNWIDMHIISKYEELIRSEEPEKSKKIIKSILVAQETKIMIEANVNPKFSLMSLWIKTR